MILPATAAFIWIITVLFLFTSWQVWGIIKQPKHSKIVYISDIGADEPYKPIFIMGTSITAAFLIASLIADRQTRSLLGVTRMFRHYASLSSVLAIISGTVSGFFLVMLSIYDTVKYHNIHWVCGSIAFFAIIFSMTFNLLENELLRREHPNNSQLRLSGWIKLVALTLTAGKK